MRDVEQLCYTPTHEWVFAEDVTSLFTVGITEHAQYLIGDIVHVALPRLGQPYNVGEVCVVLESVKSAVEVHMPFTGMIVAVNELLFDTPGLINQQAFDEGWLFQFKAVLALDKQQLLDHRAYELLLDE